MKNLIKKSMLIGLGAASVTKEKVDKLLTEFVKKKVITTKDGKWLARQILRELAKNKERIEKLSRMEAMLLKRKAKRIEKKLMKRGKKAARNILTRAAKELG